MEHFDFIKISNYMDQHMSKPANFTDVKAGRSMRMQAKVEERKSRRGDQFNKNRDIIIEQETSKRKINTHKQQGPLGIDAKSQERLKQLQQWKIEKEKKKKAAASKKPKPFIVSVVRPPLALFKSPTPVKKSATKNNNASVSDRVTRSGRVDSRRTKIEMQPEQFTFAPPNAEFHPPPLKKLHNVVFGKIPPVSKPNTVPSQPSTSRNTRSKCNASTAPTNIAQKKELKFLPTCATPKTKNEKGTLEMIVPKKAKENNRSKITRKVVKTRLQEKSQDTNKKCMETQLKPKANKLVDKTHSSKSLENIYPEKFSNTYNGGSSSESIKTPPNQMTPEQLRNEISNMSPFVTMSRGKRNVRNEMLTKLRDGCLSDDSNDQKSAQHFRSQLDSEIIRLRQICAEWQSYKDENESIIPENEQDLIFQAIGQTNLLISKKFEQFRGLVQRCEDCVIVEGEGLVTSSDLQGFWDMVFMQVENLDVRFQSLMELRQKKWIKEPAEEVAPVQKATARAKRAGPPMRKGASKIREMIEAARRAAAAKSANAEPSVTVSASAPPRLLEVSEKTFDAGFFKVHSPIKERNTAAATPNKNNSLLKEVLSSKARRMSSKKGTPSSMAMMRASYVAKRMSNNLDETNLSPKPSMSQVNLDATPARSILKTPLTNKKTKEKKSIKVVLFTQEDQDDDMKEPQPFEKLEFSDVNNTEILKSISKNTDDIPHIINKLDLITIATPVVEDVSSGKRRSRRKLSQQQAVVCEDVENVPPMEVDNHTHTHHNQLKVEETAVELKRITRSQRRGWQETLTSVQKGAADSLSPLRLTIKTPKNTPKKTPQRTPSRCHTEVLGPSEIRGDAEVQLSPFTRKSRVKPSWSEELPHLHTDLICFNSPAPVSTPVNSCLSDDSNDQKSAQHFRSQLDSEIIRLRQICAEWQSYKDENESIIPENEQDLIFQAIGQTNLLISKKFEQFRGLVQRCEDCVIVEGEGLVTSSDLQGFWDMVFMQVENLDVRFQSLMELRQKKWIKEPAEEVAPVQKATARAKRAGPPMRKGASKIREMIEAARRAAAAKSANAEPSVTVSASAPPRLLEVSEKTFDAGFFKVHSPIKERNTAAATPNKNNSLLKEVLSSKARRMSSKKGTPSSMAMMRASYVAKRMSNNLDETNLSPKPSMSQVNLDATPARSILKTPLTNKKTKEKKSIKVVLFTQEDQDDDMKEPQPFEKLEFSDVNNTEILKSISKNTDDIPHIINKLDLITIATPVVEDVSSGKRRSRRKLSQQQAVVCEDVENVPPMEVDNHTHTHHNQLKVEETAVELKRITRSQRRGWQETLTSVQKGAADSLSPLRLTIKTPKNTPKKTPQRTPSRCHTEVLGPSEIRGDAEVQLSPFTRKSRVKPSWSEELPHLHTDLICFNSPAPVSTPVNSGKQRRRSTRLASIAQD